MAKKKYQTAFGSYTQEERIEGGGSGEVYRVTSEDGKPYGLKLLRNAITYQPKKGAHTIIKNKLSRFKNEVFFCISTSHNNVVRVVDYGFLEEKNLTIPFCVMPYYCVIAYIIHDWLAIIGFVLFGLGFLGILHGLVLPTRWREVRTDRPEADPIIIYAVRKKSAKELVRRLKEKLIQT